MSKYWSDFVHGLEPYVPGEQPKMDKLVKLNTNEHPLGPSPKVIEAIRAEADARKLNALDATCPLVTKVHLEAVKYAREGYTIFLIGHHGHDEVVGTMGEAPESMILVETESDVDQLDVPTDAKVAYLTQTTLSVDDANRIIARLRQRFPNLVNPPKDDICYATQNRQEAVREICGRAQLCLVLGSQNSSNSQRLRQLADECGVTAYLIDGAGDMQEAWLEHVDTVLVTAGASAPEAVVEECIQWIMERRDATVEPVMIREENVNFPLPKKTAPADKVIPLVGPTTIRFVASFPKN